MITRLSLVLEYFHPWPNSAGFYAARTAGFYEDAGIELEIRTGDPGIGDSLEHVARGVADLAVFPTNRLLARRERGQLLSAIAAVNQRGLETVRTLESSGIRSLADLEGRRLALNPTPRGIAIVRELVAAAGGDPDEVELLDVGTRELTADDLEAGIADATFGSYWAWDVLLTERPDRPERVWRVDDELGIRYHSYLLGGGVSFAGLDPDLRARFLDATERGFRRAAADQAATVDLLETVTPYFDRRVLAKSLELIAPTWFEEDRWGDIRPEAMHDYAAWLERVGILSDATVWPKAIDAKEHRSAPVAAGFIGVER
ncbi:ABC transporter substrate-binding protein [Agromyces endophyticus]|uniref:ABC transporter substrate-binding protein n=1 Tax=Agromyces sp. H17E-10 TaxID=2932244 RepID=UPI001FD48412|nr:ABC transporter substrate-binding protein [Agromyces sp. H17E-10]UOQ89133.1 ABC transporter substrate-binding protein [Agromyces sp. H17E-10]